MELGLYVITDTDLLAGRPHEEAILAALRGGARVVQLREKKMPTRKLIELGGRLKEIVHAHGGLLIINDRVDVALATDADGVHLGQDDMSLEDARKLLGHGKLIGISARTIEAARAAEAGGADYLGTGSIASTPTKHDATVIGIEGLRRVCEAVTIPVVAIGGITLPLIEEVIGAGASGVAVVSSVMGAPDIEAAAREFALRIEGALARSRGSRTLRGLRYSATAPGEAGPSHREYPESPRVAASALVQDQEGRVLLIRRGNEPNYGLWSLPGGMVEPGERARDAAMRELEEECGIRALPGEVVDVVDTIIRDPDGRIRYDYVITVFRGQPETTKLKPSPEVLEARWVQLSLALQLPLADTAREVLNKISRPQGV